MDNTALMEQEILSEMENNEKIEDEEEQIFKIDNELRQIMIPPGISHLGVESDDDVKRIKFQMPRLYGEFDLSDFEIKINFVNRKKVNNSYVQNSYVSDYYIVEDKTVDGDYIRFSWMIKRNAAKYTGDTRFVVCLRKTDEEGIVQQEFNTTVAQLNVLEGLEVDNPAIEEHEMDVINQLLGIVRKKTDQAVSDVEEASNIAMESIDAYVQAKEAELKGDTGNVYFAAFRVVNGRLMMYSDPSVDKVRFVRVGSRLKYRLAM